MNWLHLRKRAASRRPVPCGCRPRLEALESRCLLSANFPNNVNVPPLPAPSGTIVDVSTIDQLSTAVANLQSGQTIVIAPGTYQLSGGLYIGLNRHVTNVGIRGATNNPNDVVLTGPGMDDSSVGMGISVWNAQNVTIANLTVENVYYDAIELKGDQGADAITIYNDRLLDTGEQLIKGDPNPSGGGVTNSTVAYCTIGYTSGPSTVDHGGGTGYTNGVDIHGGSNWLVKNNVFQNFHTPDNADNLWNPAVLFWNHSANNRVRGNTFINCDRAIAFGLNELGNGFDNQGGAIKNNFVYMAPGEYSAARQAGADAPIIAWDSPGTTIDQNTILVNGNTPNSIQVRFVETTNVLVRNNLADAYMRSRDGATFTKSGNYWLATPSMFVNPSIGDLHLVLNSATQANVIGKAPLLPGVPGDYDGQTRSNPTDKGADQYSSAAVTSATIKMPNLTIPNFGANPTIVSVANGNWSSPNTWSLGRTPATGDIVDINPGTTVTYDVDSSAALQVVEIQPTGTLTFRTDVNTRIVVGTMLVLQGGTLQVGTAANPIAANVEADIDLGNVPLDAVNDPQHFGGGLIVLGTVNMRGAVKTPYATLAQEAHAGDTVLHLAQAVTGWQPGDDPVLPDTRQLDYGGDYGTYQPEWERVTIQSISTDGRTITLASPLRYDHLGAHDVQGTLDFLPQVMNDRRNIMVQSANVTGVRGYTLFTDRADVRIRYAGFCELGRTTNDAASATNVADRYAMTMLDLIGPTTPQNDGYQFTLAGNEVDNDGDGNANNPSNIQWGIALDNSFYGLIQDNDVWSVAGAGIGVEDSASSNNVFDSNFVGNVTGTSNRTDQAMQGDAFWFGTPNNTVTNNIATDINGGGWTVYSYGFDIDATYAGMATVPVAQGMDPSLAGQSKQIDVNDTPILQFTGNEVYGATSSGMTLWWIGTFGDTFYANARPSIVKNFTAWNIGTRAFYGYPTNNLVIDGMIARDDPGFLSNGSNYTQGINFDDYMTRHATIENCDIQGMYTGIEAPFMVGRVTDMNTTLVQNCALDNTVNIELTPARSVNGNAGLSPGTLDITSVHFGTPSQADPSWCFNIAMSYLTSDALGTSDPSVAQDVFVTNYNGIAGDNFQIFYSENYPANAELMAGILGYIVPS